MNVLRQNFALTFWIPIWISIQGIPHTGAIRTLFLFIGVSSIYWLIRTQKAQLIQPVWPAKQKEWWTLLLLTGWLLVQSAFFSVSFLESLPDLLKHWGKILVVIWLGIAIVAYSQDNKQLKIWLLHAVFLGFFIHVISTISFQVWSYYKTGGFSIGNSFLGNYGYTSSFVTGSLAFLLTDLAFRYVKGSRVLKVPIAVVVVLTLLTFIAQGMLAAKASMLMAIILFVFSGVAVVYATKKNKALSVMSILILIYIMISSGALFSNRWEGASADLLYSIDNTIEIKSTFTGEWQDRGGAGGSIYLRYAWGKAGIEGIIKHPLGFGYNSTGYGKYLNEIYGIKGVVSSHSGWIDFALDNGILALILLLYLSGILVYRGWREFNQGNPVGLVLSLTVINYIGRCAIDGHLVGSRLTGFALTTAILWALMQADSQEA